MTVEHLRAQEKVMLEDVGQRFARTSAICSRSLYLFNADSKKGMIVTV
ncbi:MAG: hypothetical protein M3297_11140 [Thermoproteota archaeon]|nr:hypothetical protein [Thermoproteota archaeon]